MKKLLPILSICLIVTMLIFSGCGKNEKNATNCSESALNLANSFSTANSAEAACEAWKDAYRDFINDCDNFLGNAVEQAYEDYIDQVDCTAL